MSQTAEKLTILGQFGEALLQRVHKGKEGFRSSTRAPTIFIDPAHVRLAAGALKKHPNLQVPDATFAQPGWDSYVQAGVASSEQLEDAYCSLIDCITFTDTCTNTLKEIVGVNSSFSLNTNPQTTVAFLDLVTVLLRVHALLSNFTERKVLAIVYPKIHSKQSGQGEPNAAALAAFLTAYDAPYKKIAAEVGEAVSNAVGHALVDLMSPFMAAHSVDQMRNQGTLSVTQHPEKMCFPTTQQTQYNVKLSSKMYMWIAYGFLLCPEQFALPEPLEMVKLALQQSFVVPCYMNETVFLAAEYENMFSTHKSSNKVLAKQLKKDKKVFADMANLSVSPQAGPKFRKDRRDYARLELLQLVRLVQDYPGLLGPKIEVIWGALAVAKEELFWYFNQILHTPPSKQQKLYQSSQKLYLDPKIGELIAAVEEMVQLIRLYSGVIQEYYLSYLVGADYTKAHELIQGLLAGGVSGQPAAVLEAILAELGGVSVEAYREGADFYFEGLRLNCFRIETFLADPGSAANLNDNKELAKRLSLIVHHSLNVDGIEQLIYENAALEGLYFFHGLLMKEFKNALEADQAESACTYINLIFKVPYSITPYTANLSEVIGKECADTTCIMIEQVTDRIGDELDRLAQAYIKWDHQLLPENAVGLVPPPAKANTNAKGGNQQLPSNPPPIANESVAKNRGSLASVQASVDILTHMCYGLRNLEQVSVYNQQFNAIVYVRNIIIQRLRQFILRTISVSGKPGEATIQRPSVVLRDVRSYISVLRQVENFLPLDVGGIISETMLNLVYNSVFEHEDPLHWVTAESVDLKATSPLLVPFVEFFNDFVARQLEFNAVVHSPFRRTFASASALKADAYCSPMEFQALGELIGSYGVRLIDRVLLRQLATAVKNVKEHMESCKTDLQDLEISFGTDECIPSARMLRDLDGFATKVATVGKILCFRHLMYEGLGSASEALIPFIHSSASDVFGQYEPNALADSDLGASDNLAQMAGINYGLADPAVKAALKPVAGDDSEIWSLLPYMLAGTVFSNLWTTAAYKPSIDAYPNNAHLFAPAAEMLLTTMWSLADEDVDRETINKESLHRYLEVKSIIVTRLMRITAKDLNKKISITSLSSIVIFLDLFVRYTGITRSTLDSILPYAVMRSMYHDLIASDKRSASAE